MFVIRNKIDLTIKQYLNMSDFDFDELSSLIAIDSKEASPEDYKVCSDCNMNMETDINNSLTCKGCGYIKQISTENNEYEPSMNGYNTNGNFPIPIKCVGANSLQYQKQLRNTTSQYSIVQESNLRRRLDRLNFNSSGLYIPKAIIEKVVNQYKIIRETDKIHRGDIFNGIIGSLIYYECLKSGIVRKHKEISDWFNISESDLSKGDKIIRFLEEKKILSLPIYENNDSKYIKSYLLRSNMSLDYTYFMEKLLGIIEDKKIGNHNARLSTKVSAILYLIYLATKSETDNQFSLGRLPPVTNTISADSIAKEFSISASTFKTFYTAIYNHREIPEIKELFDEYGCELPIKKSRKKTN